MKNTHHRNPVPAKNTTIIAYCQVDIQQVKQKSRALFNEFHDYDEDRVLDYPCLTWISFI